MKNRCYFTLERRCGFLWLKKKRVTVYWDSGWYWEDGKPVRDDDVRIALSEAAYRLRLDLTMQNVWDDE